MNSSKLLLLLSCLAGLTSCTTTVRDSSLGFAGHRVQVNGATYETSYFPRSKNELNRAVDPHDGVGIICEEPRESGHSLSGPPPAGIHFGDKLKLTLKTEDGSRVLGRQLLRSGDVILIPSGSAEPVFISRDWNPPGSTKTSKILSEFRRLIAEHQANDRNKTKSEQGAPRSGA